MKKPRVWQASDAIVASAEWYSPNVNQHQSPIRTKPLCLFIGVVIHTVMVAVYLTEK
jgi:hypothetical protein